MVAENAPKVLIIGGGIIGSLNEYYKPQVEKCFCNYQINK